MNQFMYDEVLKVLGQIVINLWSCQGICATGCSISNNQIFYTVWVYLAICIGEKVVVCVI